MRKKRQAKKKKNYQDLKALFSLALSLILLLSLVSFNQKLPGDNLLGFFGYYIGYFASYLFGFSAYLVVFYFFYLATNFSFNKKSNSKKLSFFLFFISSSFLLTVLADSYPNLIKGFQDKIITEEIFSSHFTNAYQLRYNLGGIPFYYLYSDLFQISLKQLLSPVGSTIVFSFILFISFSFMFEIKLFSFMMLLLKKIFAKRNFSFISRFFSYSKRKIEPLQKKSPFINESKKITLRAKISPLIKPVEQAISRAEPKINTFSFFSSEKKPAEKSFSNYALPSFDLLTDAAKIDHPAVKKELTKQAEILEETLKNFGITAKVGEINCGPTITSFEVLPSVGVKVQKIKTLENDIALNLQAKSIRIIAPIPGKAAVGVEIPSIYPQEVSLKEMIQYYQEHVGRRLQIPILLGKTVTGEFLISDLTKMPHLLIAGATGSGKSVCINTIVMSMLMSSSPEDVKLLLVDPKKVELTQYAHLPHMLAPVITEAHGAYAALNWLVKEMQQRYDILKHLSLRNISAFNSRKIKKELEEAYHPTIPLKMPLIVAIFDEFADLMMVSSSDLETPIARIAQMARAVGIHLILATQRPSREIITGIIKANFPCRIAFKVSSRVNSQIILDEVGAESLLGNGDLLFAPPGQSLLIRAQGAYIKDEDINKVIEFLKEKYPTNYLIPSFDNMARPDGVENLPAGKDDLYDQALQVVLSSRNASTTFLQRKLKIGYARAASLMDELESNGVVSSQDGSRARKILTLGQE